MVYAKGVYPAPPAVVGDYAPYAQALSTANDGEAPDVVYTTIAATSTIALVNQMKTGGYTGTFLSPFYSPLLLKAFEGSYIFVQFAGFESTAKGIQQMNEDVEAVKPGTKPGSIALAGGYFAADMFIQAIKDSLKASKTLTIGSIKKAAAGMTYQIKDTIGPTELPEVVQGSVQGVLDVALRRRDRVHHCPAVHLHRQEVPGPAEVRRELTPIRFSEGSREWGESRGSCMRRQGLLRTITRRLADPSFQAQIDEIHARSLDGIVADLTSSAEVAIKTLVELQDSKQPPMVRVNAARALVSETRQYLNATEAREESAPPADIDLSLLVILIHGRVPRA